MHTRMETRQFAIRHRITEHQAVLISLATGTRKTIMTWGLSIERPHLLWVLEDRYGTQAMIITRHEFAPQHVAFRGATPPDAALSVHLGNGHTAWTPGVVSESGNIIFNFRF